MTKTWWEAPIKLPQSRMKPFFNYAIKEFINFDVKNNFKNGILLNYALCQYIKEKKKHVYI
jgi:hypothetical protein